MNSKNSKTGINKLPKQVKEIVTDKTFQNLQDEWAGFTPTDKEMGIVQLTLDKGVKTTITGTVYGMDFDIEDEGYKTSVYFDYYNKRLKIVDYEATDYTAMLKKLAWLADSNGFDKIFIKTTQDDFQKFLSHGYVLEGILRYYFKGTDAYVVSRFSSTQRAQSEVIIDEAKLIEEIIYSSAPAKEKKLDPKIRIIDAKEENIPQLVYIYRNVFETYPSPLTNPDYIKAVMKKNVFFKLALDGDTPIAAASGEVSFKHSNVEMTDCATIPTAQGKGIMQFILQELEKEMKEKQIKTAYTLARANSIGMNKSFFRLNYEYSGRLVKNCDIFGQFEDLNIWVKRL